MSKGSQPSWFLALAGWSSVLIWLCQCSPPSGTAEPAPKHPIQPEWFIEKAQDAGLNFQHENGAEGAYYLPEIMGSGSAFFDFDRDGDLDIFLVQSGPFPPTNQDPPLKDRLFRNDSPPQATPDQLRFTDVTQASGIHAYGYGMGVAVADIDRDGWPDLYITNFGDNQLWHNQGDGRFKDITTAAGANDPGWSVSASFCDVDRDGWPDLIVGNYTEFSIPDHHPCYGPKLDYCHPRSYQPQMNRLLRNQGNRSFKDVTTASGLSKFRGRTLGIVVADFNGDQLQDIYVANDAQANFLWMNQGGGNFEEAGLFSGSALNLTGQPEGSMGVDAADFDEDGDEDLFISHLRKETNTLYCNDGTGFFEDCSNPTGLGQASLAFTGFGAGWLDVDRDGLLDIFVSNGSVAIIEELAKKNDPLPYHQTNQLFRQISPGKFADVSHLMGEASRDSEVSRGTSFGDVDNDGDYDLLVSNNDGPVRLYINQAGTHHHWLGFILESKAGLPYLGNTKVAIHLADGTIRQRRFRRDGSYLSSNDPRLIVGLGKQQEVSKVEILWPNGQTTYLTKPAIDRYHMLRFPGPSKTSPDHSP